ncbi:aspartate kinase [Streptomyces diastatochromogenes]|uniref:amino acid kinase family protein n=1 Tax=Streptomyces diastatochromogenes TaxID=42236 RepID=UPI000D1BEE66|nr:aspartate kinase [Streptomyces diastatochromogenes]MCZ0985632.1 aspartate kinase [Streptomyces diastatochromogenes]
MTQDTATRTIPVQAPATRPPRGTDPATPAVLEFGGSSFPSLDSYCALARALHRRLDDEQQPLVVVVSAMPGETEKLLGLLHLTDPHPVDATSAALLGLADTASAHLLAGALHHSGVAATVLAGQQLGLVADGDFLSADVDHLDPAPLRRALETYQVVVVPGGQAADRRGRPTRLGPYGAELSAVLVAGALGADRCEIHADVDGVCTADPGLVQGARLLPELSYETAALMARYGTRVLHRPCVRAAEEYGVALVRRRNRAPYPAGTRIGATGVRAAAVVLNTESRVLGYRTDAQADHAHGVLGTEGVDTVRLPGGPQLAVIGGQRDLDRLHRVDDLPEAEVLGVPVTEITGTRATTRIARDPEEAVRLARRLHDALVGQSDVPA